MTTADIHALTGAYALDAVSGVERMEFERHLAECESCAQEVRELRDTAARLGVAAAAAPPPDLKNRVLNQIREVRQLPPETPVVPLPRRSFGQRLTSVAAGVFFVASAGLGVVVVQQNGDLDDANAQVAQVEQILKADDGQLLHFPSRDGGTVNVAMSPSENRMLLLTDLPGLPDDETYQAWTIDASNTPHSLGTLGGKATLPVSDFSDAAAVAVSREPAGGSDTPTDVLGKVDLPV